MKIIKIISLIIILILCTITLTGCYDSNGIENLAYVIAIGLDKGENLNLKLSLQIPTLSSSNSSGNSSSDSSSGGSSSQASDATVISVECSTIDEGLNLINSYISKKINLSHCKAIIISEELSKEGISEYIFTFANNLEIRPNCHILISKTSAYDFLNNFTPSLESIAARYYELILNSSSYSGYTENNYLYTFYEDMLSTKAEASAILVNLNKNASSESKQEGNSADANQNSTSPEEENTEESINTSNNDGAYTAGDTPIKSQSKNEALGTAVFKGDKFIGELNNIETLCHLIIASTLDKAEINIPNPFDETKKLSLSIRLNNKTKNRVDIIDGTTLISCNVKIAANVNTMDYNIDLTKKENLEKIEKILEDTLRKNISDYLYKTSKEFNADISGFGKYAIPKYLTWKDWEESNWLENYQNALFNVNVKTTVESGYLYNKI